MRLECKECGEKDPMKIQVTSDEGPNAGHPIDLHVWCRTCGAKYDVKWG